MNRRHRTAAELAGHDGFSLISNQKLLQLYAGLVQCRLLEERVRGLFPRLSAGRKKIGKGQEAARVAAAVDLLPDDSVIAAQSDFLFGLIQGKPLKPLLACLSERAALPGQQTGWNDSLHRALGTALAHQTRKDGKIVLAYCGEDSEATDAWEEALQVAGANGLPILFVRYNNQPEDAPSRKQQTSAVARARKAGVCGFPVIPVDGTDAVAVYRVATESIAHVRKGSGPTLIECGPAPSGTAAGKVNGSAINDPVRNMEAYLTRKNLFHAERERASAARFAQKLDAALSATVFFPPR